MRSRLCEGARRNRQILRAGLRRTRAEARARCCGSSLARRKFDRDDIAGFIDLLPEKLDGMTLRHAIEPRHESFSDEKFFELCRARNIAVVFEDSDEYPLHRSRYGGLRLRAAAAHERGRSRPAMMLHALDAFAMRARQWQRARRRLHFHDQRRQSASAGGRAGPAGTASLSILSCALPTSRSGSACSRPMAAWVKRLPLPSPRIRGSRSTMITATCWSISPRPAALQASLDRAVSGRRPDPHRHDWTRRAR